MLTSLPINALREGSFTYDNLWDAAKSFAIARGHTTYQIESAIKALQEIAKINHFDLLTFAGFEDLISSENLAGPADVYYACEHIFQDLVHHNGKEKIRQSTCDALGSALPVSQKHRRKRESEIILVYLRYLSDTIFHNRYRGFIELVMDSFEQTYQSIYDGCQMPPTITKATIVEVLQSARLGYQYQDRFYPFWYTVRKGMGQEFNQKLVDEIKSRFGEK